MDFVVNICSFALISTFCKVFGVCKAALTYHFFLWKTTSFRTNNGDNAPFLLFHASAMRTPAPGFAQYVTLNDS